MPTVTDLSRARIDAISRRRLLTGLLAASAIALPSGQARVFAQTPEATPVADLPATLPPNASDAFRAVAEALVDAMEATGTPGAAIGILAEGREEHAVFGVASIESGDAVTADTLFQTGSITKTFTGTAVMRLVEDGALDLEAPVRTYLPDLRLADEEVAERVTVRHLLTHTGGWWGDLFVDTGDGDDGIEQYVADWFPELPQLSPLGQFFSYNNAGFILLGRLVETVAGQEYRAAMDELVLEPLGLGGSFFAPEEVAARPHALGHFVEEGVVQIQEPLFLPRATDPAGGLWSTTRELLRYARFHLGDGTVNGARILSQETLETMQTPQQAIVGDPTSAMGLPWFIIDLPGQRLVLHDGGTFGQHSQLWLAPDREFAMALFVNALPAGSLAAQAALGEVLNQYFGLGPATVPMATPMASPVAMPSPVAPPPDDLEQYAGTYATPDATFRLDIVDGAPVLSYELHPHPAQVQSALVVDVPSELPLQFVAEDVALVTFAGIPLLLVFVRDDEGEVGWVSASLRLIPKVDAA